MAKKKFTLNADIKAELQRKGLIQPDKGAALESQGFDRRQSRSDKLCQRQSFLPRLNRRKFSEETRKIFNEADFHKLLPYLVWGLDEMMNHGKHGRGNPDLEAIGAAKVLRLAVARRDFDEERKARGESGTYAIGDLIKAVNEIYMA